MEERIIELSKPTRTKAFFNFIGKIGTAAIRRTSSKIAAYEDTVPGTPYGYVPEEDNVTDLSYERQKRLSEAQKLPKGKRSRMFGEWVTGIVEDEDI